MTKRVLIEFGMREGCHSMTEPRSGSDRVSYGTIQVLRKLILSANGSVTRPGRNRSSVL
jgi:hypothetical protein